MLPFELTKDTPYLPFRASYGVSFMSTSTEIDRVIKGFYCMYRDWNSVLVSISTAGRFCAEPLLS